MSVRGRLFPLTIVVGLGVVVLSRAWGQALPSSAKVDTEPLDLTEPDRYAVPSVLEPVRRVTLMATADGVVRSQDARAGAAVREGQEIAQLDRGEAGARLKIAQAEVKEQQTFVEAAKEAEKAQGAGGQGPGLKRALVAAQARLEAAQARAELSQIAFDQCSLRAPFSGKVMVSHVSDGQYVTKGTIIADLADVSSLRTLVPLTRAGASVGGTVTLSVEGQPVPGKIQSLLPLPEELAVLRELASPISAAWVVVPNTAGTLEPGQRVVSPVLPVSPIVTVPAHSFLKAEAKDKDKDKDAASTVQVIRNEYVTNVKVRVLGNLGPERVQVTGPLRATDALIVSASVPLLPGTLIRFNPGTAGVVEPTSPNPAVSGVSADITPPRAAAAAAPIGSPGSALPKTRRSPRPAATSADPPKTSKPSSKPGGPSVPF